MFGCLVYFVVEHIMCFLFYLHSFASTNLSLDMIGFHGESPEHAARTNETVQGLQFPRREAMLLRKLMVVARGCQDATCLFAWPITGIAP